MPLNKWFLLLEGEGWNEKNTEECSCFAIGYGSVNSQHWENVDCWEFGQKSRTSMNDTE